MLSWYISMCGLTRISLLFLVLSVAAVAKADVCAELTGPLRAIAEVRPGSSLSNIECQLVSSKQLRSYVETAIGRNSSTRELSYEEQILKVIGFLPQELDYRAELIRLYAANLVGYFEPVDGYLALADSLSEEELYPTVIHELAHAIQNSEFKLEPFIYRRDISTDELLARLALIEGEASVVMFDVMRKREGKLLLRSEARPNELFSYDERVPASEPLRKVMLFPYKFGLKYVHHVLRDGGYQRLKELYQSPVHTTSAILHYRTKLQPVEVTIKLPFKEYKLLHEDSFGEFILRILLEVYLPRRESAAASTGFITDRIVLLKGKDSPAWKVVWDLAFVSVEEATEFSYYLRKAYVHRFLFGRGSAGEAVAAKDVQIAREGEKVRVIYSN